MASLPQPAPIQLFPVTDFTGGLNLRADAFQLASNESPDMTNIDLDPRGGFAQRKGVSDFNSSALPAVPRTAWSYFTSAGITQVIAQVGNNIYVAGTSGVFTPSNLTLAVAGKMRATTFKNIQYVQRNAEQVAFKWDGATATNMGTAFQEDLTAPTGANVPQGKFITNHMGYVWVANTLETAVAFPHRVRWSHFNQAGDYRALDYIDVNLGDGDSVTALVPFQDRLLVFKNNSVHAITGAGVQNFATHEITHAVGTISQESVVATEYGVYFFSWPNGLMFYDGKTVVPAFDRLRPALEDATVNPNSLATISVGYINKRIWVGVPFGVSTVNDTVFVLDPSLRSRTRKQPNEGAWTKYNLPLGVFLGWKPPGQDTVWLATDAVRPRMVELELPNNPTDGWRSNYASFTGVVGSYASAPDSVALSVTGDLSLTAKVALDDWTGLASQSIIAKWNATGNQRSYNLFIDTGGFINLAWSTDGTATLTKTSTVATALANGAVKYVRATLDVNNGAAGNDVKFYMSDDGVTFTQLGATVTTGGVTSIFDSSAKVIVMADESPLGGLPAAGKFYIGEIRAGLPGAGSIVGSPDFTALTATNQTTFTDGQSNLWTLVLATINQQNVNVITKYTTRWHDLGTPAIQKRWKRPEIILKGGVSADIVVQVLHDYDASTIQRTLHLVTASNSTAGLWDVGQWDVMKWGGTDSESEVIIRMGALGRSRAVQLIFTGPTNPSAGWQVDAITFKYIPRRVRA